MYEIKQSTMSCDKGKFICVLQNPNIPIWDTKVIYGGSYEIVERKVQKQLKSWELSKDEDNAKIEENKVLSKAYYERLAEENKNSDEIPF